MSFQQNRSKLNQTTQMAENQPRILLETSLDAEGGMNFINMLKQFEGVQMVAGIPHLSLMFHDNGGYSFNPATATQSGYASLNLELPNGQTCSIQGHCNNKVPMRISPFCPVTAAAAAATSEDSSDESSLAVRNMPGESTSKRADFRKAKRGLRK